MKQNFEPVGLNRGIARRTFSAMRDIIAFPMIAVFSLMAVFISEPVRGNDFTAEVDRALSFEKKLQNTIFRSEISASWLPDGKRFWYRVQTSPKQSEYVLVAAESGAIKRAQDLAGLGIPPTALLTSRDASSEPRVSRGTGVQTNVRFINRTSGVVEISWLDADGRKKTYATLPAGETREQHTFAGHVWLVTDERGDKLGAVTATAEEIELTIDAKAPDAASSTRGRSGSSSPDGRWRVRFDAHQVVLVETASDVSTPLTTNGTAAEAYRGPIAWAPDSQSFVVHLVKNAPVRKVTVVESRPKDQVQPKVHTYNYAKPGDELPSPRVVLFRLADRMPVVIDATLYPNPFTPGGTLDLRWSPKGDEFTFDYNQRGHQLYRVIAVDAHTGAARTVVEEKTNTFIDYTSKTWRQWCDETGELLWMSERDGWTHLWLYDAATGAVKNQVTRGEWVVRKVVRVDEQRRQVWFLASGLRAGEDPYHRHLCRINFDGSGLVRLTEGDGDHEIAFSPDNRFFIDSWSRVDLPPVTELRSSEEGKLVCELERADISALLATGWKMPERFVAKGRDGVTDIHGIVIRPISFDAAKRYPVIENVYAGPHGAFAPKKFSVSSTMNAMASMGFVVVQSDGMGTNYRGKRFHDVAWKNLQDSGFPDRIAWMKAAAATRSWIDLSRVGIYGGSAGGQSAMRALLDHGEFYRAAFADCGCHDNRMDKIWWNEQWLGWPVDESYIRASNVVDAFKLKGALMLCVGELDRNVDPASTMQVADALQKAGKPFELVVITGADHGAAESPYGRRKRLEFFSRQLIPTEPRAGQVSVK